MSSPRILVAGIGNIFLGDDAFGVEVVTELLRRPQPESARIVDFGVRGRDLAYTLLDGYDVVLLVDACPRGHEPGTLFLLELEPESTTTESADPIEGHNLDPAKVLRLAAALGAKIGRCYVLGCEPSPAVNLEDMTAGLSPPVRAAVSAAVPRVETFIHDLLDNRNPRPTEKALPCPS
jgi:hydrogenase maturation protease